MLSRRVLHRVPQRPRDLLSRRVLYRLPARLRDPLRQRLLRRVENGDRVRSGTSRGAVRPLRGRLEVGPEQLLLHV